MRFSVVLPAYNASAHISKALASIVSGFEPQPSLELEIIVIDDGSEDAEALQRVCAEFPTVRIVQHSRNRGMCAARNSGIAASSGDFVTLLDADDEFVPDWFAGLRAILAEWPDRANVCYTPCLNDSGERTCMRPDYRGWLTAEDMVKEHLSGEYNPIFRGDYIRLRGYEDLGTRKSCGLLTYLKMAREAPFWISDKPQRLYHDAVEQSVTHGWTRPEKAAETYRCFASVLAVHGDFIRSVSPEKYQAMCHKILIYQMLSRQGRNFSGWWRSRSWGMSWFATLPLLLMGPTATAGLLGVAKRWSLLRRYG